MIYPVLSLPATFTHRHDGTRLHDLSLDDDCSRRRRLHRPALRRGRIRIPLQSEVRTGRIQPHRMDGHGGPRIHCHDDPVARIRTRVRGRAARALRAFRMPLPATGLHLPATAARTFEDAAGDHPYGSLLQRAQRPDAGRMDLPRRTRRLLRRMVLPSLPLHRRRNLHRRHGHQPPLRPYHPPPAQTGRHPALYP